MHIFLTGEIQVGKSTVIRRTLEKLYIKQPVGFTTSLRPFGPLSDKQLYLTPPYLEQPNDCFAVAQKTTEGTFVNQERFDELGEKYLSDAKEKGILILMDELGWMEQNAHGFQRAVLKTLAGDKPVLGVVQKRQNPWTNAIRAHPNVRVITVTQENRDYLPDIIAALYPY